MEDICRLCLNRYGEGKLQNIFEYKVKNSDEDDALSNILFWTFGVEVDVSDLYVKTICSKCIGLVEQVVKCRKDFQYNQDHLKNGLFPSKIETGVKALTINKDIDWDLTSKPDESSANKMQVSFNDLELLCGQPTVPVRRLEQTYAYQGYKRVGPRRFRKRKRSKLELDDSIVNEICRSLEHSKFQDLSNPQTRTIGVNTGQIVNAHRKCSRCENNQESPSKISEDCGNFDQDSGMENDDFVQDIIKKSASLDSKDDLEDWTQMTFKKDVDVGTEVILTRSIAISTEEPSELNKHSVKLDLDDFKKFKLKIKTVYCDEKQDNETKEEKNIKPFAEEKFDPFVSNVDKKKLNVVESEGEELFKQFMKNSTKSFKTVGTMTDSTNPVPAQKPCMIDCGTLTKKPKYMTKHLKGRIIKQFLVKQRANSRSVGTSTCPSLQSKSKLRSVATITDPLPKDKFVVHEESLELFSPVVLLTPLEYTVEQTYEQMDDTTFVLKDRANSELLKERQQRFIDYYYGFSSFGIRELVAGTVFRDKEKENTDMAVCQVSSVCDVYICNLCSKQFNRESSLKNHSVVHHNEDKNADDVEVVTDKPKRRKRKNGVIRAPKQSHKKKANPNKIDTNKSNTDETNIRKSEQVENVFDVRGDLDKDPLRFTNDDTKYMQMKLHLSKNNVDLVFSCTLCDFSSNDEYTLYYHRRNLHYLGNPSISNEEIDRIEVEFACDKCDFYFDDEQALYRHQMKSHEIAKEGSATESGTESELELIDVENDHPYSQSNNKKNKASPKYVWESKKFGKYSALSSHKQKLNLLNSSDDSSSSPNVTPQKKVRRSPDLEDDFETVRNLQKTVRVTGEKLFLSDTVSKLNARLDDDES